MPDHRADERVDDDEQAELADVLAQPETNRRVADVQATLAHAVVSS